MAAVPLRNDDTLVWKVNRGTYFAFFVTSYLILSWLLYLAAKTPDTAALLLLFGPFFASIAWSCQWIALGAGAYKLSADRLDIFGFSTDPVRSIPLKDVILLNSRMFRSSSRRGGIVIATPEQRHVIPRWVSCDSRKILDCIGERLVQSQPQMHSFDASSSAQHQDPDEAGWSKYKDIPKELLEILQEASAKYSDLQCFLFRGPLRKGATQGTRRVRLYFIWMTALGFAHALLMLALKKNNYIGVGIGFVVAGIIFGSLAFLAGRISLKKREWLMLHTGGVAMIGANLTGELTWQKVSELTQNPRRGFLSTPALTSKDVPPQSPTGESFVIQTADEATIPVLDLYDAPVFVIYRTAHRVWSHSMRAAKTSQPSEIVS